MIASIELFVLSEDTPFSVEQALWAEGVDTAPAWRQLVTHTDPPRPAILIRAGCAAVFNLPPVAAEFTLHITIGAGLPQISRDGLGVFVAIRDSASETVMLRYHVAEFQSRQPWQEFAFPLRLTGTDRQIVIGCTPGPQADPGRDWLALYELVIARDPELSLHRSRAFGEYRLRNELNVVSGAYDQPMYEPVTVAELPAANACELSNVLLGKMIGRPVPDFGALLHRKLAVKGCIQALSLASGSARVEAELLRNVQPGLVELTLTDVNEDLLRNARAHLAPHQVRAEKVDLNHAKLPGREYDIILCVSGLHHVVELEALTHAIATKLRDDGEFWVIGEYVGKTGARLWPDAYAAANRFFRSLPERYRYNHVFQRVDADLPNVDCSIASFESIRSEEIEPILASSFEAEWTDKRCCFIWRLFDAAYAPNFNVSEPSDQELVRRAVEIDYDLLRKNSRAVTLNGVFLPGKRRSPPQPGTRRMT